jgi:hypothetical protein
MSLQLRLCSVEWLMITEFFKDLEGSGHGLLEAQCRHLNRGAGEDYLSVQSGYLVSRPVFKLITSEIQVSLLPLRQPARWIGLLCMVSDSFEVMYSHCVFCVSGIDIKDQNLFKVNLFEVPQMIKPPLPPLIDSAWPSLPTLIAIILKAFMN